MVRTAQNPMTRVEPYEFMINVKLKPAVEEEDIEGYDLDEGYDDPGAAGGPG